MLHGSFVWNDNFREKELKMEWQTLRMPTIPCWVLRSKVGQLVLQPGYDDLTSRGHPCFLGRRQQHADFIATVELSLKDTGQASDAGLAIFQNEHSFFFLGVRTSPSNTPEIFVEQGSGTALAPAGTMLARKQLPAGSHQIELRITDAGPAISFSYRLPEQEWIQFVQDADATLLSTSKAGGFVGSFIGPFSRLKHSSCRERNEDR